MDKKEESTTQNSPGAVILQWLTYAFWGWLILALIWLMSVILINAIIGESTSSVVPYAVAASVVLLPITYLCDLFYRKQEPQKKSGAAMVIMVIHAVIFALLGIGTLITAVFIGVNALVNLGDTDGQMVALLTCLFAAVLYGGAFLRTLNPFKSQHKLSFVYSLTMLALTVVLLILAIVGPLLTSITTRSDRMIESGLSSISTGISRYTVDNNALPTSLDQITTRDDDAQLLIRDGLVTYIPEGEVGQDTPLTTYDDGFRYQLCVEYSSKADTAYSGYGEGAEYSSYPDTSGHPAGKVCYKLETTRY